MALNEIFFIFVILLKNKNTYYEKIITLSFYGVFFLCFCPG